MGICPDISGGSVHCPSADGQSECGSKTPACGRQVLNAQLVPRSGVRPANDP